VGEGTIVVLRIHACMYVYVCSVRTYVLETSCMRREKIRNNSTLFFFFFAIRSLAEERKKGGNEGMKKETEEREE
jgi:hypothetical protein